MLPAINYDYHAVRTNPGVKGLYAAANNPANRAVFHHCVEKHCSEKDRLFKEEMAAQGIEVMARSNVIAQGTNAAFSCSIPAALLERIQQQESKCDTDEMLEKLRAMFDLPVIVTGSEEDNIPHWAKSPTGGTLRLFRISKEMLRKMEADSEVFRDITERMRRFQDGLCEFLKNHDGVISNIQMYIDEYGIAYAYSEDFDAPSSKVVNAKKELDDLIDFFIKWLDKRNKSTDGEETVEDINESLNVTSKVVHVSEDGETL